MRVIKYLLSAYQVKHLDAYISSYFLDDYTILEESALSQKMCITFF